MIDMNRSKFPERFDVTVGYHRVRVEGTTREEVIHNARRALCSDLPRLYDVIRHLDASRFMVEPVQS